jgi:asparagine synthase (glutamine-hydrolysing)
MFKKAMSDILPREILTKKKHGFGLPVGVWFRDHAGFRQLLNDVLLSRRALERGYFERRMIERLVQRHQQNVWDYTQELWLLLMLELWHREHVDA